MTEQVDAWSQVERCVYCGAQTVIDQEWYPRADPPDGCGECELLQPAPHQHDAYLHDGDVLACRACACRLEHPSRVTPEQCEHPAAQQVIDEWSEQRCALCAFVTGPVSWSGDSESGFEAEWHNGGGRAFASVSLDLATGTGWAFSWELDDGVPSEPDGLPLVLASGEGQGCSLAEEAMRACVGSVTEQAIRIWSGEALERS